MNFDDLILDLGDKYMEKFHNTAKHISNVVNAYFDDGYAHIDAIAMSDAVLNIWLPCGIIDFLYVSNKRLAILPENFLCVLQLLSLSFPNNAYTMIIVTNACV